MTFLFTKTIFCTEAASRCSRKIPFIALSHSYLLGSTLVFFHYNQVRGVVIATQLKVQWHHLYAKWTPQQWRTLRWWHTCCSVYFFVRVGDHGVYYCIATSLAEAGFKKMSVSIFMNEMLSWVIRWHHWVVNRWHAIHWARIFRSPQITWNRSQVNTEGPGTRYYYPMENLKTESSQFEPTWVGISGKGLLVSVLGLEHQMPAAMPIFGVVNLKAEFYIQFKNWLKADFSSIRRNHLEELKVIYWHS